MSEATCQQPLTRLLQLFALSKLKTSRKGLCLLHNIIWPSTVIFLLLWASINSFLDKITFYKEDLVQSKWYFDSINQYSMFWSFAFLSPCLATLCILSIVHSLVHGTDEVEALFLEFLKIDEALRIDHVQLKRRRTKLTLELVAFHFIIGVMSAYDGIVSVISYSWKTHRFVLAVLVSQYMLSLLAMRIYNFVASLHMRLRTFNRSLSEIVLANKYSEIERMHPKLITVKSGISLQKHTEIFDVLIGLFDAVSNCFGKHFLAIIFISLL